MWRTTRVTRRTRGHRVAPTRVRHRRGGDDRGRHGGGCDRHDRRRRRQFRLGGFGYVDRRRDDLGQLVRGAIGVVVRGFAVRDLIVRLEVRVELGDELGDVDLAGCIVIEFIGVGGGGFAAQVPIERIGEPGLGVALGADHASTVGKLAWPAAFTPRSRAQAVPRGATHSVDWPVIAAIRSKSSS
jgi:hypothetical protein